MKIVVSGTPAGSALRRSLFCAKRVTRSSPARPKAASTRLPARGSKSMAGAQMAIDLANSPSFEHKAVLEFFETSGRNLLAAEAAGSAARSRSARSGRWARRASAISVSTNGSAAQKPDPASANRRTGFYETHPLFAARRDPAVRQRPRGCAQVEERQGDPRLPARAAERS